MEINLDDLVDSSRFYVTELIMIEEMKALLISELNLEDISADDIEDEALLFGEGLGLDSIDALELAIVLDKKYGVKIKSGDDRNIEIFSSVKTLANFISENRTK